jgi:hypothetical protein
VSAAFGEGRAGLKQVGAPQYLGDYRGEDW